MAFGGRNMAGAGHIFVSAPEIRVTRVIYRAGVTECSARDITAANAGRTASRLNWTRKRRTSHLETRCDVHPMSTLPRELTLIGVGRPLVVLTARARTDEYQADKAEQEQNHTPGQRLAAAPDACRLAPWPVRHVAD